jgi:hypothetical protein
MRHEHLQLCERPGIGGSAFDRKHCVRPQALRSTALSVPDISRNRNRKLKKAKTKLENKENKLKWKINYEQYIRCRK